MFWFPEGKDLWLQTIASLLMTLSQRSCDETSVVYSAEASRHTPSGAVVGVAALRASRYFWVTSFIACVSQALQVPGHFDLVLSSTAALFFALPPVHFPSFCHFTHRGSPLPLVLGVS